MTTLQCTAGWPGILGPTRVHNSGPIQVIPQLLLLLTTPVKGRVRCRESWGRTIPVCIPQCRGSSTDTQAALVSSLSSFLSKAQPRSLAQEADLVLATGKQASLQEQRSVALSLRHARGRCSRHAGIEPSK